MVNEFLKARMNAGEPSNLFFWRDSKGLEIDLLIEEGDDLTPVEIKSGQTIAADFFAGLTAWLALAGQPDHAARLVYGGDRDLRNRNVAVTPWARLPE